MANYQTHVDAYRENLIHRAMDNILKNKRVFSPHLRDFFIAGWEACEMQMLPMDKGALEDYRLYYIFQEVQALLFPLLSSVTRDPDEVMEELFRIITPMMRRGLDSVNQSEKTNWDLVPKRIMFERTKLDNRFVWYPGD